MLAVGPNAIQYEPAGQWSSAAGHLWIARAVQWPRGVGLMMNGPGETCLGNCRAADAIQLGPYGWTHQHGFTFPTSRAPMSRCPRRRPAAVRQAAMGGAVTWRCQAPSGGGGKTEATRRRTHTCYKLRSPDTVKESRGSTVAAARRAVRISASRMCAHAFSTVSAARTVTQGALSPQATVRQLGVIIWRASMVTESRPKPLPTVAVLTPAWGQGTHRPAAMQRQQ